MRIIFNAAAVLLLCAMPVLAADTHDTKTFDFADGRLPEGWIVKGDVTIDKNRSNAAGGASLRVGPGGSAIFTFQNAPGAGRVELLVYEDGVSVDKPKAGHNYGVLYGVGQGPDQPALVAGSIYAAYLAGDATYSLGDFTPGSTELPSHKVSYLGLKRTVGWHKWTFDMEAEKGLKVLFDGKAASRFDWNTTRIKGINQVVIFGDKAGGKQIVWVDSVSVTAGAEMKAAPTPPPPPPPVVPEADPQIPAAERVKLIGKVAGKHPRLLFSTEDVAGLKAKADRGYGKLMWERLMAYLPSSNAPKASDYLTNDTDGLRQGFWRMPTVAVHYAVTGDRKSYEKGEGFLRKLLAQDHWQQGTEQDSGMSSANILFGAALLYDTLYNDLPQDLRDQFRDKLLLMARRQYYRGHLKKAGASSSHYWQNDPQNNHRWHRDSGLVAALVAVAGECDGREDWMLREMVKEIKYISDWLPVDGTSHEGPTYMPFGAPYLAVVHNISDRCLGTDYLKLGFWQHSALYRLHSMAPGMKSTMPYGDCSGDLGFINDYTLLATGVNNQSDLQAAMLKFYDSAIRRRDDGSIQHNMAFMYGWLSLLWYNDKVPQGSLDKVGKNFYFDDVGLVFARDGWQQDNVALMFKCSPYGGYMLNRYRNTHDRSYINVAHDDPDANTFVLYADGGRVIDSDGYSYKKSTSSHNTILVNGKGQKGSVGGQWSQPLKGKDADMSRLAFITTYKDAGNVVIAEGEAGNSYENLNRFRRAVIWVNGKYVLVLDDIRGPSGTQITWLNQSRKVEAVDAKTGRYRFSNSSAGGEGEASIAMQLVANGPMQAVIGDSTAANRKEPMGYKQLQAAMPGENLRVAAVYDAWKNGDVSVTMTPGDKVCTVTVSGKGFRDVWSWTAATDNERPAGFKCTGTTRIEAGIADWAEIPYEGMGRPQQ